MKKKDMYKDLAPFGILKTNPCVFQTQEKDPAGRQEHFEKQRDICGKRNETLRRNFTIPLVVNKTKIILERTTLWRSYSLSLFTYSSSSSS